MCSRLCMCMIVIVRVIRRWSVRMWCVMVGRGDGFRNKRDVSTTFIRFFVETDDGGEQVLVLLLSESFHVLDYVVSFLLHDQQHLHTLF